VNIILQSVLAGVALAATEAPTGALESLPLVRTIELKGPTHHVQGIDVAGGRLWVTSVDTASRRGLLSVFDSQSGALVRAVQVGDRDRYHPGGLSGDAASIWIPVAEYKPRSTAVIERRNRKTLAVEHRFTVPDHIGCVAATGDSLAGANWDAREIYIWNRSGKLLRKVANPAGNAFQDLKYAGGYLVGGGLLADRSGAIDWLEFPALRRVSRLSAGKTDRGVAYTHEGMAIHDGLLYLLPEDAPSRVFVFRLPD
jgi:hypothetical protein